LRDLDIGEVAIVVGHFLKKIRRQKRTKQKRTGEGIEIAIVNY
jgi:hypothetical protein